MKMFFTILLFVLFGLLSSLVAGEDKVAPTYLCTFDDHSQLKWVVSRDKGSSLSQWGFNSKMSNPQDKYATHDYPVGGDDLDTCRDWFISPKFAFYDGAKLRFDYKLFSMMGNRTPADRFELYISKGSNDPIEGDFTLLFDLSDSIIGDEFQSFAVELPFDSDEELDSCYIAFLYQATNNWYIPGIDNIVAVVDEPSSVTDEEIPSFKFQYQNETLILISETELPYELELFNTLGSQVYIYNGNSKQLPLEFLNKGFYLYRVKINSGKEFNGKILVP